MTSPQASMNGAAARTNWPPSLPLPGSERAADGGTQKAQPPPPPPPPIPVVYAQKREERKPEEKKLSTKNAEGLLTAASIEEMANADKQRAMKVSCTTPKAYLISGHTLRLSSRP